MNKFEEYLEKIEDKKIIWVKPDFKDEVGEYFENEYTKNFLKKKNIVFNNDDELIKFLESGSFKNIGRKNILKSTNMTLNDKDFDDELKNKEYRKSFDAMQKDLNKHKILTLESPILIEIEKDHYFGFAGNRRTNLAFRNNLDIKFWVIRGY